MTNMIHRYHDEFTMHIYIFIHDDINWIPCLPQKTLSARFAPSCSKEDRREVERLLVSCMHNQEALLGAFIRWKLGDFHGKSMESIGISRNMLDLMQVQRWELHNGICQYMCIYNANIYNIHNIHIYIIWFNPMDVEKTVDLIWFHGIYGFTPSTISCQCSLQVLDYFKKVWWFDGISSTITSIMGFNQDWIPFMRIE